MELMKTQEAEAEVDAQYDKEFDEIIEQAAPTLVEMAAKARQARREGRVMKFPA